MIASCATACDFGASDDVTAGTPTDSITDEPTDAPTGSITDGPTEAPTDSVTDGPTEAPSDSATSGNDSTADTAEPADPVDPTENFKFTSTQVVNNVSYSTYSAFVKVASPTYRIPALAEGMIPQGMDIWADGGLLLISGYFADTSVSPCSVLLAVDLSTGKYVGEYYLKNSNGTNHTGHAGGVAVTEKNIYISENSTLLRIPLSSLKAAGSQGDLKIVETVKVPVRASFCNCSGGYLWVGDFYYGTSYPTDEYRHMTNNDGNTYYAWSVGFKLDTSNENDLAIGTPDPSLPYVTPDVILSIDQKIQGFAVVSEDWIALSQSYGRKNNSKVYLYKNVLGTTPHKTVTLNGESIPLWFLDSKVTRKTYTAPPMTEGLAAKDGTLYILFESGADKYRNGGGKYPTDTVWLLKP